MTLKEVLLYDIQRLEQINIPVYLSNTVGTQISNVISDLHTCCDFLDQEAAKIEKDAETSDEEPVTEAEESSE